MENLKSPWVHQLVRSRPIYTLETDVIADICIIGGGISGIMSAYQILKHTERNVVILDSHEIAHGATGHNAGQLVEELERTVASLVEEFGLEKAIQGIHSVHSAWNILEEIMQDAGLSVPFSTFVGYSMYSTKKQVLEKLVDLALMHQGGLNPSKMYISAEHAKDLDIPKIYAEYYQTIPHESIMSIGETVNPVYIAAFPNKRGCLNSALLTEQLATYLVATYGPERCKIYEKTTVSSVHLERKEVAISTIEHNKTICAKNVLLCTNGFEKFTIHDLDNKIDHKFHKNVKGVVGYMLGRTEEIDKSPSAFAYCDPDYDTIKQIVKKNHIDVDKDVAYGGDYMYTTRRPYDIGHEESKNLFCIGGKAQVLEDSSIYGKEHTYQPDIKDQYEAFIRENFPVRVKEIGHREFVWHGLMGYTHNGVRMVGYEKKNPLLMYNLGCNGVGILPSIWSGKRIADLINGDTTESMFDPK